MRAEFDAVSCKSPMSGPVTVRTVSRLQHDHRGTDRHATGRGCRHWRTTDDEWALSKIGPEMAVRSRKIPEERILQALEAAAVGTPESRKASAAHAGKV
jgi:hypothetical protein